MVHRIKYIGPTGISLITDNFCLKHFLIWHPTKHTKKIQIQCSMTSVVWLPFQQYFFFCICNTRISMTKTYAKQSRPTPSNSYIWKQVECSTYRSTSSICSQSHLLDNTASYPSLKMELDNISGAHIIFFIKHHIATSCSCRSSSHTKAEQSSHKP